jgi:hypothetical protein
LGEGIGGGRDRAVVVAECGSRGGDVVERCQPPPAVEFGPTGMLDHLRPLVERRRRVIIADGREVVEQGIERGNSHRGQCLHQRLVATRRSAIEQADVVGFSHRVTTPPTVCRADSNRVTKRYGSFNPARVKC